MPLKVCALLVILAVAIPCPAKANSRSVCEGELGPDTGQFNSLYTLIGSRSGRHERKLRALDLVNTCIHPGYVFFGPGEALSGDPDLIEIVILPGTAVRFDHRALHELGWMNMRIGRSGPACTFSIRTPAFTTRPM